MGRKSVVLINPPDTQVYSMAAPDATGDLNNDTGFLQSYQLPQNALSAAETSVTAAASLQTNPMFFAPLKDFFGSFD